MGLVWIGRYRVPTSFAYLDDGHIDPHSMSSHSGPHLGATRSTRYFPVSAFPTFESTDLALSFTALSSHPRYREALKPFDQGHLDRYRKSAELLQRWESIAERYTAIDPEEDTEIDV